MFQPCVSVSQPACSALPIRCCWAGRALSWLPLPHQPLPVAADELREACLAYNPISQQCRACWRSRRGSPGKGLLVVWETRVRRGGSRLCAAAGSATPSGSAGGADSWHRSVLGDLVEVPPRPRHPQPDLFSVLRRIEKLLQVEDSSSRHCQVLPAEHRQRHSRCCSQEKQASFFFFIFIFNTSYLCDSEFT